MKQLVITVHGIRTFGDWQGRLESLLRARVIAVDAPGSTRQLQVRNYKLGYISIIAFWIPFLRWLVVRRFRRIFVDLATSQQWDRIDLVGHSYGTHIIAWGLYRIDSAVRPQVNTIILAGSVLKENFRWERLIGHGVTRLVNDCGVKDKALLASVWLSLFTGAAGRHGFSGATGSNFCNRFFNCGHSGFFRIDGNDDDSFMERYWVPLLLTNDEPVLVDERPPLGVFGGIMLVLERNTEPIKLLVIVAVFFGVFQYLYNLHRRASERLIATKGLLFHLVDVVSERVRPFSELGEVNALLVDVQMLIDRLPPEDKTEPHIALPQARAFITLAELQWERGDIESMNNLANLELKVLNALGPEDRIPSEAQELLARGKGLVGLYYSEAATGGDKEKARQHFQDAILVLERLEKKLDATKRVGADWHWLRSLAQLRQGMGDLLNKLGNVEEAKDYYAKSAETWKKLKQIRPTQYEEFDYELAWASNKSGDIYWSQGRKEEALTEYSKAQAGIAGPGTHFWKNLKWPHRLSIVQNNIGLVLRGQGRHREAIGSFREAQKQLLMLVSLDSTESNWSGALAWTYDNLGETRVRWARAERDEKLLGGADKELQDALEIRKKLILVAKENARWKADFDISRANMRAYNGTKNEISGNCILAALDFLRAADDNPKVDDERADLMILRTVEFLEWGGRAYRNAGNAKEAERIFGDALRIANGYELTFGSEREAFAHIKEQLNQDLRNSTTYEPGVCIN